MANLSKSINREGKDSKLPAYGVGANAIIFRGAMTMINAAGFLVRCSALAGSVFAGISRSDIDATGEANGDSKAIVESEDAFYVTIVGAAAADMGKKVYATDDNLVAVVQVANTVLVGRIIEVVSATKVLVKPNSHNVKA